MMQSQEAASGINEPLIESGSAASHRLHAMYSQYRLSDARMNELDRLSALAREATAGKPSSPYTIGSFLWLIASCFIILRTDFCIALLYDSDVKRGWLLAGAVCIAVTFGCAFFCIVYLSWLKKVKPDDWDVLYPSVFPLATSFFLIGGFFLTVAIWPVYTFLTPAMLFTLFMGFVCAVSMWPSWLPPFGLETAGNVNSKSRGNNSSEAVSHSNKANRKEHDNLHTD